MNNKLIVERWHNMELEHEFRMDKVKGDAFMLGELVVLWLIDSMFLIGVFLR